MIDNTSLNYMQSRRRRIFTITLFWGSIWGIVEASLGLILHAIKVIPTGAILFPLGYYFMQKSYKETGHLVSIFYTSVIAASIKLINLFSPIIPSIRVLNPAACILLEGLGVVLVFKYLIKISHGFKLAYGLAMSIFWRIGYYLMCFAIFIPLKMMDPQSIINLDHFIRFFLINSTVNSLLIYAYEINLSYNKESNIRYNTVLAASLYLTALIVQWII